MKMNHLVMVLTFLFAASLAACSGGGGSVPNAAVYNAPPLTTTGSSISRNTTLSSTPAASYVALNAGGSAIGTWGTDSGYDGGQTYTVSTNIDTSRVTAPAPKQIYQTQRWARHLNYTISHLTPNAPYTVKLHFAETYFSAIGQRIFSVRINGVNALSNLDLFQQSGGKNIALVESFPATANASGSIVIGMDASVNNATIAGIEAIGQNGTPSPVAPGIKIDAGGGAAGSWLADTGSAGGWTATVTDYINTSHVDSPAPQSVYQSQRTGVAFSYRISDLTPNAPYSIRLDLVESWFNSAGQRAFNVTSNGVRVLSDFDTYREAGGKNVAIAKSFNSIADQSGQIRIDFVATINNASVAGIELTASSSASPQPSPSVVPSSPPSPSPSPTGSASGPCAPTAVNPLFSGCFTGNSPYHHTAAELIAYGGKISTGPNAINYWNNGNPLEGNNVGTGTGKHGMWISAPSDPQYAVTCSAYGICDAATSMTGLKVNIPRGAAPSPDSDHHFTLMDQTSGQEIDMWGGYGGGMACQVGTYIGGELTCSWGGTFKFSGNGLASVPGNSGNAGGVAFGMAGLTAGDILSGHITHALAMLGPCLDNGGIYPGTPGRSSDYPCQGGSIPSGRTPAEPSVPYGALLVLKPSVNLDAPPYSNASPYCKIILRAYQEYGFYADDNSSGYGLRLILNNQADPGWNTINASMIAGGDATGSTSAASNYSCLNRVNGDDLEAVTLNQGDGSIPGGDAMLPPLSVR